MRSGDHHPDDLIRRAEALTAAMLASGRSTAGRDATRRRLIAVARRWGRTASASLPTGDALAVAHLLAHAGLPSPVLADRADELITVWSFGGMRSALASRARGDRGPAEVTLMAVTTRPAAARSLLERWEPEALDLLLFMLDQVADQLPAAIARLRHHDSTG